MKPKWKSLERPILQDSFYLADNQIHDIIADTFGLGIVTGVWNQTRFFLTGAIDESIMEPIHWVPWHE